MCPDSHPGDVPKQEVDCQTSTTGTRASIVIQTIVMRTKLMVAMITEIKDTTATKVSEYTIYSQCIYTG